MSRHLRILRLFWTTSLGAEMEYRANFLMAAIISLAGLAGSVLALSLFYFPGGTAAAVGHPQRLGGWKWEEALLVLGLFTLLDGLTNTLLSPNLSRIVQHVRSGTLDFVLLKPIDAQFWLSTRNVSPWGLPNIAFGLAILAWAGRRLELPPWAGLHAVVPLLLGVAVLYSMWFVLGTTSIWFVKIYNATEVLRSLTEAGKFPLSAYPAAVRAVLTFIVPVAFLTTVPAQAILGRAGWSWLAGAAVAALALLLLSRWFWLFALRHYTSASS